MEGKKQYKVFRDELFEKKLAKYIDKITDRQALKIDNLLGLLGENPFNPMLKTHKLKGRYRDLWAFSINYSDRISFQLVSENTIILIDIGDHDDVY